VTRAAVARYASRFHRVLGGRHGVASPLGAWLLLALVGPSAMGDERERIADALGCDVDEAFTSARRLLADPHPELAVGSAVWHAARVETDRLLQLVSRLAPPADAGPMPSQDEVDGWAREHTKGLIERFPLKVVDEYGRPLVLLLATALATKVSWEAPFDVVASDDLELPVAAGFAERSVLRSPQSAAWEGFLDTAAGLAAAYVMRSRGGLLVASVVGDPAAEPALLLDAAQGVASDVAAGRSPQPVSLWELPLGEGPAWRLSEEVMATTDTERYEVLLPAWTVTSQHSLMAHPEFGFPAAGAALIALLRPGDFRAEARQSAMARYTREGFEAAAVTGLGVRTASFRLDGERRVRTARIEFTRPHAVVAATEGAGDWDGLPVFAAWVGEAVAAD
jgi:hypothetical protein